jgi:hypothetical protein
MSRKVHHTDRYGALEFKKLRKGSIEWCSNDHSGASKKKNARYTAFIMSIHAAFLCSGCKKEWIATWKENSPIEYL